MDDSVRSTTASVARKRAASGRTLVLGSGLALALVLAIPGPRPNSPRTAPVGGKISPAVAEPEAVALARLRARVAGSAQAIGADRRARAEAQVSAIRTHLDRYRPTRHPTLLYSWWAVTELEVLDRPAAARRVLEAWAASAGPADAETQTRILRLQARVLRRTGDTPAEAAVLGRLATCVRGAERRLVVGRLDELTRLSRGSRLPAVGGTDLGGARVGPEAWRGRVVLIDLWDPTAPMAAAHAAELRELRRAFAATDLAMVGVPLARGRAAVESAVERFAVDWPQLFDPTRPGNDHPVAGCLSPNGKPARYLVDRRGIIRERDLRGEALRLAIDVLVREPFPAPMTPDS